MANKSGIAMKGTKTRRRDDARHPAFFGRNARANADMRNLSARLAAQCCLLVSSATWCGHGGSVTEIHCGSVVQASGAEPKREAAFIGSGRILAARKPATAWGERFPDCGPTPPASSPASSRFTAFLAGFPASGAVRSSYSGAGRGGAGGRSPRPALARRPTRSSSPSR